MRSPPGFVDGFAGQRDQVDGRLLERTPLIEPGEHELAQLDTGDDV